MCTHTRQVENQRCSRTCRVQKNHIILGKKNTIFNERRVYNPTFRLKKKFLCAIVRISACVKRLGSNVIQIKRLCFIFSCRKSFRVACMACFPISLCTYQSSYWYSGRLDVFKEEVVSLYNIYMKY